MAITQQQKDARLQHIAERARVAEENGLIATAKSWRELYATLQRRPCLAVIFANHIAEKPTE